MNPLEAELDYPLGDLMPEPGHPLAVAPGVRWLRMPLPFALNHVNLWLLEDEDPEGVPGWTIVDCGFNDETTRRAWEQVFETGLLGRPVLRVLATHFHPDHVGCADWLCKRWQAPLWMSAGEYGQSRISSAGLKGTDGPSLMRHYAEHGFGQDVADKVGARRNYYSSAVPEMPIWYHRIHPGETVRAGSRNWQVINGYGHSPEHVALYDAESRTLISGDMVLPRISTNVSVSVMEPEVDPVGLYLGSLERFEHLPSEVLVLPSHGKPFRGIHARLRQLREHHALRLQEVLDACHDRALSAADVIPVMFPRALDDHQLSFALGEALAHLNCLWARGQLRRFKDADAVWRFAAATARA